MLKYKPSSLYVLCPPQRRLEAILPKKVPSIFISLFLQSFVSSFFSSFGFPVLQFFSPLFPWSFRVVGLLSSLEGDLSRRAPEKKNLKGKERTIKRLFLS